MNPSIKAGDQVKAISALSGEWVEGIYMGRDVIFWAAWIKLFDTSELSGCCYTKVKPDSLVEWEMETETK